MVALSSIVMLVLGLPALIVHLFAVALTKSLQTYSRSRLEEYCSVRGRPDRALEVAHLDERTERGAEVIAVCTGLLMAALCGVALERRNSPPSLELLLILIVLVAVLGYMTAGVLGKVFAEPLLYAFWPASWLIRGAARPLTMAAIGLEHLIERLTASAESTPRPASVEVEIPAEDGETDQDLEVELPEATRTLVQRAVELARADVSEVMIPAAAIVSLPSTVTAQAAAETFRRTGRSRIPMFGANRDDILGILIGKDLWDRMVEAEDPNSVVPALLVRPAFCVPESGNAYQLIEDLRGNRTQMAIVLNEYGSVAGLVTLEDLLEQLVGPIDDEHDVPTPEDPITALGGTRFEIDAATPLEVLNNRFDLHLPTQADFETVAGLAMHALGRLPEKGVSFCHDGIEFTILDVRDHSIRRVMLDLHPAETRLEEHSSSS